MSDKIREAFEHHAKEVGMQLRYEGSALATAEAHAAWRAWQAALAQQPAQATIGDEQAAFENWRSEQMAVLERNGYPDGAKAFYGLGSVQWSGWQARSMLAAAPAAQEPVQMHHEPHNRAMWHANCPGRRFSSPMRPRVDGSWVCVVCGAVGNVAAPPAAEQPDTVKVSRELLEELAGDLAAEVDARYSDKDHPALKHKYERDMRPVLEARALLAGGEA